MDLRGYEASGSSQKVATHAALAASAPVAAFGSILFPPGFEERRPDRADEPDCFIDLNLDQVIAAVVAKRDEEVLRPIFYSCYRNEEIVRYRQAVFADLERPDVFALFPVFREAMRSIRADLGYAEQISYRSHKHTVFLRAVGLYCRGVTTLLRDLRSVVPQSPGLGDFLSYLTAYSESASFRQLASETAALHELLSNLSYGMLFRGDQVTVRRYASEPDYTVAVLERFAKFRETEAEPPAPRKNTDGFSLNHIEQAILEFVSRLFPVEFRRLDEFVDGHSEFIDETIARFDREIGFYVAYLDFIDPLKRTGLPFCHPEVSVSSKETLVEDSFDLALAAKLVQEKGAVVRNDFHLSGHERLLVVSGPNQGGKTTFARMFGQLHFLAGLGCPVPGKAARLFLPDRVFTHFDREEDITNLRGKLEDELVRLHVSCETMTSDSVIVLNEIFNSTSLDDQVFLSTRVLERILATDAIGVCVTFIDALSTLSDKTVSMVSTVDPEDSARRTFEIVRKPADGLAYALSLAQKHGVTYEQLRKRVRP
ncbi:MAG: DNA mismatch repair protein MutS [Nitrobacter sp.]